MAALISGGLSYMKVAGRQYMVRGSVKIKLQNYKLAGLANADGSVVFTSTPVVPGIAGVFSDYGSLPINNLVGLQGATVIVYLKNGKSYVLTNATWCDEVELNSEDGAFPFNFQGSSCTEQLAAA